MQDLKIVILAAGKGTRLASLGFEVPKPLIPIEGKTMISYLVDSIQDAAIDGRPIIITAPDNRELFEKELGDKCEYVEQKEQLGTGHAVACAREKLFDAKNVLVLYGDHPTISAQTIHRLAKEHEASQATITMATVQFPDFDDWRKWFINFGRILRDEKGQVVGSVEAKDATEEQKKITEVNPCYYVFRTDWLRENIDALTNKNVQQEYYLTDLVARAFEQEQSIHTFVVEDPIEAIGVNTPEQLKAAEDILLKRV